MLSDGSIIDSASLPPNAVEEYPVTFTGASLVESSATRSASDRFNVGQIMSEPEEADPMRSQAGAGDRDSLASTQEMSVQGRPVTLTNGTLNTMESRSVPASAAGTYLTTTGMESIHGHPVSFSGGQMLDTGPFTSPRDASMASQEAALGTQPDDLPASGSGPQMSTRGLDSVRGHPLATYGSSLVDSAVIASVPGSARGRPPTSGGLPRYMSRNAPPALSGASGMRSAPVSTRGSMVDYTSDSARRLAEDFPMTFSDVSMTDVATARSALGSGREPSSTSYSPDSGAGSIQHPESESARSRQLIQEFPLTFSDGTFLDSGALRSAPGSVSAYPVASTEDSGSERAMDNPLLSMSMRSTGAIGSLRGHPITMSGRSTAPSLGYNSRSIGLPGSGRDSIGQLASGSYAQTMSLTPEALQASRGNVSGNLRPYGGEGELESLPESSVLDSTRGDLPAGPSSHPLTGTFLGSSNLASGAVRSAPGSFRDRRRSGYTSTSGTAAPGSSGTRPTSSQQSLAGSNSQQRPHQSNSFPVSHLPHTIMTEPPIFL